MIAKLAAGLLPFIANVAVAAPLCGASGKFLGGVDRRSIRYLEAHALTDVC
jgi:hypothetical protein